MPPKGKVQLPAQEIELLEMVIGHEKLL